MIHDPLSKIFDDLTELHRVELAAASLHESVAEFTDYDGRNENEIVTGGNYLDHRRQSFGKIAIGVRV